MSDTKYQQHDMMCAMNVTCRKSVAKLRMIGLTMYSSSRSAVNFESRMSLASRASRRMRTSLIDRRVSWSLLSLRNAPTIMSIGSVEKKSTKNHPDVMYFLAMAPDMVTRTWSGSSKYPVRKLTNRSIPKKTSMQ